MKRGLAWMRTGDAKPDSGKLRADSSDAAAAPAEGAVSETPPERLREPSVAPAAPDADRRDPLAELAPLARQSEPLLACLAWLTRFHGKPVSEEVLQAGLPEDPNGFTPSLFLRAAERAGFSARVVRRRLTAIPEAVLPIVVTERNGDAYILLERAGPREFRIVRPGFGEETETVPAKELAHDYTGYAIYLRPTTEAALHETRPEAAGGRLWFWGAIARSWWSYAQVGLATVLINLFALITPLFIMIVYDRVIPNNAIDTLWVLAAGAATVIGFDFIMKMLRAYFIDSAGKKADVLLAGRLFDQVLGIKLSARPGSAGAFANTLREFETLRDFFTSATLATLIDLPFVIVFLGVIWLISGEIAFVLMAAVPIVLLYGLILQWPLGNVVRRSVRASHVKHGILVEAINGLETIKAIGADARARRLWENAVGATARTSHMARTLSASGVNVTTFVHQIAIIGVVVFGVHLVADNALTLGGLIACVILGGRALAPLGQVAQLLTRYHQSMTALGSLNSLMRAPVERAPERKFVHRPKLDGAIEFRKVVFGYEAGGRPVLDGVSFSLKPGERVGVIGRIGSGKSTIAKLLLGLYEPREGAIYFDGTDQRQIDPIDLRRNIGYVPQDPFLFSGTIRDNIAAVDPRADDNEIRWAARLAGISEFVERSSAGYDQPVGERGDSLSGGQRQGVTIARALLRRPSIMVMDEPTSQMDSKSEQMFVGRLKSFLENRTLVLITHRASLLALVDRLIVVDDGRVIMDGPRDDVLHLLSNPDTARTAAGAAPAASPAPKDPSDERP